jgi:hypothetical protein
MFMVSLVASAQTTEPADAKVKSKPTSTIPQKVHNTFSKHKHYSGHKAKAKTNTK